MNGHRMEFQQRNKNLTKNEIKTLKLKILYLKLFLKIME